MLRTLLKFSNQYLHNFKISFWYVCVVQTDFWRHSALQTYCLFLNCCDSKPNLASLTMCCLNILLRQLFIKLFSSGPEQVNNCLLLIWLDMSLVWHPFLSIENLQNILTLMALAPEKHPQPKRDFNINWQLMTMRQKPAILGCFPPQCLLMLCLQQLSSQNPGLENWNA